MALDHGKVKPLCQRIKSKGLSKFVWGEVGVGAKGPFPSHSIDHQAKGSSIGHQAKNLLLATKPRIFYWPPSQEPSIGHQAKNPHPLFKRRTWDVGALFFFSLEKTISIES